MTLDELEQELAADASFTGFLSASDYTSCCVDASRETGWDFPVTDNFKRLWLKNRAKRHGYFLLWTQAARKFKFEQINLNQRFDHYGEIIKKMDDAFEVIKDEYPEIFLNLDSDSKVKMFGDVVGTGLVYDLTGKDVTRFIE